MSTVKEIEDAIRALSAEDRAQLADDLPEILPELNGDAEWRRIIDDARPRPALDVFLAEAEAEYRANPDQSNKLTDENLAEEK
jgi:hypothetical protein